MAELAILRNSTRVKSNLGTMNRCSWRSFSLWVHPATRLFMLVCLIFSPIDSLHAQMQTVEIVPGTPLSIGLPRHSPMRSGAQIEGHLLYPVYVGNRVALPAGASLRGRVIRLDPDRGRRIHSRLRGDFTPFHVPVVQFDQVIFPDDEVQPIFCSDAKDGMVILRLSPPPGQKKGSLISRQWSDFKQRVRESTAIFTAPGRGDRLVQFIYTQLPYHPQRIETGTTWTVELAQPLRVELDDSPPAAARVSGDAGKRGTTVSPVKDPVTQPGEQTSEWRLRAYLQQTISSAKAKPGDTFQAYVAEPVLNSEHAVVVPEGSLLTGEITRAKPARSFGRQGKLRFHFKELKLPSGFSQPVEGTLSGVDSDKSANLQIDPEGGIQPQSQNRVVVPLLLTFLAGRAFDDDENQTVNSAIASNGFGIVGRVVGIAASSRNVAAGIGIYGAALSFYDLWLARGHDVVFPKDTRVEITTTPSRSPLKASPVEQTPASSP
jgi:hypothetical protein